jgi:hypothetical protein
MDDETLAANMGSYVEKAFSEGTITAEDRSSVYKNGIILDEDLSGKSLKDVASAAADAVSIDKSMKEKLTENDYKEILAASYNAIGNTMVIVDKEGNKFGEVVFNATVNGVRKTYVADITGESRASKKTENALNNTYGDATLALYNGKIYYQYGTDKWVQIGTKAGFGKGEGNDVLAVIAAYYGANGIVVNDRSANDAQNAFLGTALATNMADEVLKGTITREQAIKRLSKAYSDIDWERYFDLQYN